MRSTSCWGNAFRVKQPIGKKNSCNPLGLGRRRDLSEVISTKVTNTHPEYSECANNPKLASRISLFAAIFDQFQIWRVQMVAVGAAALVLRFRHFWCYQCRDVETDENGGKALCNVNYNSPPPWPSSLLHLCRQKTAGSSQTKRNFQLRQPKATGAEITLQVEALFEFPLTRNSRRDRVVSHLSYALEQSQFQEQFRLGVLFSRIQHNN